MLEKADRRSVSLRTVDIFSGASANAAISTDKSTFDIGTAVAWRMRSGMGRGGVVMMRVGILRRRIMALSMETAVDTDGGEYDA